MSAQRNSTSTGSRSTQKPGAQSDNQAPEPVNIIVGGDEFLTERHKESIIAHVRLSAPEGEEIDVSSVRAGDVTESELIELLSPSLFGEDRVVVIHSMADAGKEPANFILEAAKNPTPGITLIIEHSGEGRTKALVPKLMKLGSVYKADAIPARELSRFVTTEFRRHNANVTPDVSAAVVESVGSDLRELASAVSQLVADNNAQVDLDAVRRYYTGTAEINNFAIADDVIAGKTRSAVAGTRRALQLGTAHMAICTAVSRAISDLAKLSTLQRVDPMRDARKLGMAPWKIKKMAPLARRWSQAAVAEAVQVTALMEAGIKGGAGDQDAAVELAVRRLAELAKK